jgi:ketosteroid isomerase-like protein
MSARNVETVERFFDTLNRDDVTAAFDGLPYSEDDFELDMSRSVNPDRTGIFHSREEAERALGRFLEAWSDVEWFATEYVEVGDTVIRVGGIRVSGRGSGIEIDAKGAQVWEFRDGKAVAVRQCQSKEQALEVAGAE